MPTITRANVQQVPVDFDVLFRQAISDGSAVTLVADRRADFHAPDVHHKSTRGKVVTTRVAANVIAARWTRHYGVKWTRSAVLARFGATDSTRDLARGDLRAAYLAAKGGRWG